MKKLLFILSICALASCVPACSPHGEEPNNSDAETQPALDSFYGAELIDTMDAIWTEQDSLADILINAK